MAPMADDRGAPLRRADLTSDPLEQFDRWFGDARSRGVATPEAVALATAARDGAPSVRMVLLKGYGERGFAFHTNYDSRKGRELADNPRAALLFYWREVGRQVRVEGAVERAARAESAAYFRTRPLRAQTSAWASRQSEPVESREALEARFEQLARELGDDPPLPPFWGGLLVVPEAYEFWQHRDDRLHDRFRYTRSGEGWAIERLQP